MIGVYLPYGDVGWIQDQSAAVTRENNPPSCGLQVHGNNRPLILTLNSKCVACMSVVENIISSNNSVIIDCIDERTTLNDILNSSD